MERFTIEPSMGIYNLFNFANFNLPPTTMFGVLNGPGTQSINGTTSATIKGRTGSATARASTRLARNGNSNSACA